tara:strand:- start:860 stop:1195 length:336 start_codon:yes stop_codon:yes gene_type:complete
MSNYPDKWVVFKITNKYSMSIYKVFASWYGGFAGSDSWKLNSGITKVSLNDNVYSFEGYSGSVYECHKRDYGTNLASQTALNNMIEMGEKHGVTIEVLPENTNWLEINYAT